MDLVEYLDEKGRSPFENWFRRINAQAAAKVTTALVRLEGGNTSNAKSLGSGVHELKIDFGPGYRIYFGYDGPKVVILLAGGTKKRQDKDIETAKMRWADYKVRKKKNRKRGL
jgi:putative addiction module killer protein